MAAQDHHFHVTPQRVAKSARYNQANVIKLIELVHVLAQDQPEAAEAIKLAGKAYWLFAEIADIAGASTLEVE